MPDQPESPDQIPADGPTVASPSIPKRKRWWQRWKLILGGLIVAPLLAVMAYTWLALSWSYSKGDRSGVLQKFSAKGWICKTWEGELLQPSAPGVPPTIWHFTVRDDSVAQVVNTGLGKPVVVTYEEHRGVPTNCFGDTDYFVTGVRIQP